MSDHELPIGNSKITAPGAIGKLGVSCIIYDIVIVPISTANNSVVTLSKGTNLNATGTNQVIGLCSKEKEHSTIYNFNGGLLLQNGGYLSTSANVSYALVTYRLSNY